MLGKLIMGLNKAYVFIGLSALLLGTAIADEVPSAPPPSPANGVFSLPSGVTAITITTGGGGGIAERDTGFLKRRKGWRMHYTANPVVADTVNQWLADEGHDVMSDESAIATCQRCWIVEDVYVGPIAGYAAFDSTKETRTTVGNRIAESIVGVALSAATKGWLNFGPHTEHWGKSKHITMAMVDCLPSGASKMLVTRISNPLFQARQEVLTAIYGDASDDELRKINSRYLIGMLGLKSAPDVSAEELDGKPYCGEEPTTYVTGPVPSAGSALEGRRRAASEISVDVTNAKGSHTPSEEDFGKKQDQGSTGSVR